MRRFIVALLLGCMAASSNAAQSLSYADLVRKLVDLEQLAVLPADGEKCAQWSSWDRASKYDETTGKYIRWDANGDNAGMIRSEGDSFVMAEMEGPGCIWRIWSAAPKEGHVRIYLDGNPEPVVDLPFAGYFDLQNEPFVYPSLVHDAASGKNCYVPIPYSKSCKIVADKDWGAYYQFVYTTFPKGTKVPTFTRNLSGADRLELAKVDYYLRNRLGTPPPISDGYETTTAAKVVLAREGQKVTVARMTGAGAITAIRVKPEIVSDDALRHVILRIYWDGERNPSVEVPLGDFFGTGPGANFYKSLPLGMTEDGYYSFWYMPYSNGAVVELASSKDVTFSGLISITKGQLSRAPDELGRFHAKWHRDAFLPPEPERWIDWTMITTQGRGRFCGVALEVWNPRGGWWGEGDEKFHVDGEAFPSTFGTGSEDYFGYAWCNPGLFQNAFHNQTRNDGNNVGHVSVNRWHVADNIPFSRSFEGYIEKYCDNKRPTLYACTAYWYLAPGGIDPYTSRLFAATEKEFYPRPEPYKVKGAIEGEKMKTLSKTGGVVTRQELGHAANVWSEDAQIWWVDAQPKDTLVLELPVEEAGKYEIRAQMTKAADYGEFQLYINEQELGEPLDLYNGGVVATGEVLLGVYELPAGSNKLKIEVLGANEQSQGKKYLFGLDYVRLVPVK